MLLPDPEFEKMLKTIDKHVHATKTGEEPEIPFATRLRQIASVACSRRQLWRRCAGKRCRRTGRCCGTRAWPSTEPLCAALFDDWERGFHAGAAFALGSAE